MSVDIGEVAVRLLADQGLTSRARTAARTVLELLPGSAVNIYILGTNEESAVWRPAASAGEVSLHSAVIAADAGTLGELFSEKSALLFSGPDLPREQYAHLDIRRTVRTLAYLPLVNGEELMGAVEILSFEQEISEEELAELEPLAQVTSAALVAAQNYEIERGDALASINRLTQLYDMEKTFSSTLEMDELLPIIGSKIREVMECQAVNIWLLQPDESVELMHQSGFDPTMPEKSSQKAGEGLAGGVSDNGEPLLVDDPEDARLVARNRDITEGRVVSLIIAPIMDKESLVGVIEVINKMDGTVLDDDDLFALGSLADTASTALHNASLLLAERKVEILETLVTVSQEITSTLNLERMLQTIVDAPQAVIPYQRAAIVLADRGRFKLSAVTGQMQFNPDAEDIKPLNSILQWAALSEEIIHVRQHDGVIDAPREETRAKFEKYFAESGVRGFYAMPLGDDTGRVGMYALESSDPDFLSPAHIEILQVLAGQATVALRNAQMYKEVPFISVLEPVLERKRRFMAMEKKRRTAIVGAVIAAIVFLAIVPLPLRVDGSATVAAVRRAQVQPEIEGVVGTVYVHEGEHVKAGQVLAELNAWDYRSALAGAEAKYQTALLQVNHSLAGNDTGEAGVQRVQADYWKGEVERAKSLLDKTQLRSPIDGVVATPHVENLVGRHLQYGDTFADVMDTSRAVVDVAVDDADAGLLRAGQPAVIKLNSYAMRTFHGDVVVVSPKGEVEHDSRIFYARVLLPNGDGAIRSGMEGRGKVRVPGYTPAGYVIFRRPVIWIYSKLWSWFGW
ncbi:MAG TPA: efflux RND transporter periplasmic adaptor subunit [Candidatus Acidoferrum sp.]|nr:efflux RND transporter periplasmic adaptor subunit [Candidatus Acidoferrum sp.]